MIAPFTVPNLEKIWVDKDSWDNLVTKNFLNYYPSDIFTFLDAGESPSDEFRGNLSAAQFAKSKKQLWLRPFKGQFFKRCPGATQKKVLTCCNYHVLNLGQQCNFNCSYCYLQSYLNSNLMQIYTNIDQAFAELRDMANEHPNLPFRVGTGEVIDSLSFDPITLYSKELIKFFKSFPNWTLEFKTKSHFVDQFFDSEHAGNIVVSWSINPSIIVNNEEHGTSKIEQRLAAARLCKDRGFQIAFHLDPMIAIPDWKNHYGELIDEVSRLFKPEEVHVTSIGSLRFQPEQRHMMRERFGMKSYVTQAEMLPSQGGKLRFDEELRQEMMSFAKNRFIKNNPGWRIFFCMETPETWISSFEATPMQVPELKPLFRPLPKITDKVSHEKI